MSLYTTHQQKVHFVVKILDPEKVQHASRNADSCALFCIGVNAKNGKLSQHFMTRVIPPLYWTTEQHGTTGVGRCL